VRAPRDRSQQAGGQACAGRLGALCADLSNPAVSQAEAAGSVRALAVASAVGGPVLLVAFAFVCWTLVGRSLQPVSRLRSGAEEIAARAGAPKLSFDPLVRKIEALLEA